MTLSLAIKKIKKDNRRTVHNLWDNYILRFFGKIFAVPFVYFNINPILIIIIGFLFEILGVVFLFYHYFIFGLIFLFLGKVFDNVDGITAHALNRTSAWGKLLDETRDMITYFFLWIAISFLLYQDYLLGKNYIIFSYLALTIPIFKLLSFHIMDRSDLYTYKVAERAGKEKEELISELKEEKERHLLNSLFFRIKFKLLSFLKRFSHFSLFFWNSISFLFLAFSLYIDRLYLFLTFSLIFALILFVSEISRKFFYNKLILKKYPL